MLIDRSQIKRVCVIQLGRLGDVFLSTSYFEVLKKQMPDVHITFLVKAGNHRVLRDHPYIDELFIIPKAKGVRYILERVNIFRKIANAHFDLVLDHQYKPSSMYFALASGAKFRIGLAGDRFTIPFSYTHTVPYNVKESRYSATQKFDLISPLGFCYEPYTMYLSISTEEQQAVDVWLAKHISTNKPIVVISPGSVSDFKCWAQKGFAQIADYFAKQGNEVIFIWGPGEEAIVKAVMAQMQEKSTMALPTTPQEGVALLKRATLFISNDGGMTHLSVVVKVKTVTIFAGTEPSIWSPSEEFATHKHLYNTNKLGNSDKFAGISATQVIQTAECLLNTSD
ncbi:MAG: ADP-heptose:LPS heptosyltransferase [Alteromonadaceae bacterium]|jgi:ADP-heptose:LPS heptosyltransferase